MKNSQKISIILGIATFALALGGALYNTYLVFEFTDLRVIDTFQDSDPKFHTDYNEYRVEERKLINTARGDVIFPEDELNYKLKVYNLKSHDSKITYELKKFKGGEIEEPIALGEWTLHPNTDETRAIKLFLKEEGSYDLKLNLFFYNGTNQTNYAQFSPPEDKIEVLSHADKLQSDANTLNFYGLVAASVIGASTVIALAYNVHYSRKEVKHMEEQNKTLGDNLDTQNLQREALVQQNRIIEQHHSEQNRPWLAPTQQIIVRIPAKQLLFSYKNFGKAPAINIEEIHKFSDELPSRDEVISIREQVAHTSVLVPEMTSDFSINNVSDEIIGRIENGTKPLFLSVRIDFEEPQGNVGQYGVIFEWDSRYNVFNVKDEWVD